MIPESFSQLTTDLEAELYRLHYTQATTNYYRRMWGHVATFLESEGAQQFTEELGLLLWRHVDISTTEIYARADTELKRQALEKAYPNMISPDLPEWKDDADLLAWLTGL